MMIPVSLFRSPFWMFMVIFSMILLNSCASSSGDVEGHYFSELTDQSKEVSDVKFPNLSNKVAPASFEKDYFIDFFSDGTYTMNLHKYEHGSYDFRAGKVLLYPSSGDKWQLRFSYNEELDEAVFNFPQPAKGGGQSIKLKRMEHRYKADYPYTEELNQWRVTPKSELSNNELIEKLQNHLRFMRAYLIWSKKVEIDLDIKQMSGPLRYGNDGFSMRRLSSTGKWCDYFKEGDCQEMDYILRNQFDQLEIEWNFTYDRIAMLGDALGQLISELNNQKENFEE